MNDCPAQSQQRGLLLNCQSTPYLPIMPFEHYLPRPLGPYMLYLSLVSQFPLGPSLCRGSLLRPGGRLLRPGGLLLCLLRRGDLLPCLLRRGGFLSRLFRPGGLRSRLLCPVGLQFRPGGLLSRLLSPGGLQFCLFRPGGLLSRLLHPGGLQFRLFRPGGLQSRLLRPGGLRSRLLRAGGLRSRLLRPGGLLFRLFRLGSLLCRLCLGSWSWHFLMDLALRPSPGSTSAPPPSWIVPRLEHLEAAPWGGALSRIWMPFHHMDSCTPPQTTFPIIHCTDHTHTHTADCTYHIAAPITQLSPITRSSKSHHTHLTKDIHFLFLPAEYCFACSILLMLATYQVFTCLCSVSCIVLRFSLSQCQLLYGAPPKFLCLILVMSCATSLV